MSASVTCFCAERLIGGANNLPMLHKGSAATAPYMNFQGRTDFVIDCHLVRFQRVARFSFQRRYDFRSAKNTVSMRQRLMLLGVTHKDHEENTAGNFEVENIPPQSSGGNRNPLNIGICIKAKRILEFVPRLDKFRHERVSNFVSPWAHRRARHASRYFMGRVRYRRGFRSGYTLSGRDSSAWIEHQRPKDFPDAKGGAKADDTTGLTFVTPPRGWGERVVSGYNWPSGMSRRGNKRVTQIDVKALQ
jgi:hypothetical protein